MAGPAGGGTGGHRGNINTNSSFVDPFDYVFGSSDSSSEINDLDDLFGPTDVDLEIYQPSDSSANSTESLGSSDLFTNNDLMQYLEGLFASVGQENAENRLFNAEQAELARIFSASEAQKNRDFQALMSNTSYQRAVKDLQKAGLNPILAYQQGGASTPSSTVGSSSAASYNSGSGDTLSSLINAFANLISSASGVFDILSIVEK